MTVPPRTDGHVLRASARAYDLLTWVLARGRERAFRERVLDVARVAENERLLDVGCGTGSLAVAACRRVGPWGAVTALDASPEMLARAGDKARRADVRVDFHAGVAESLPFEDGCLDVVVASLVLHHLPRRTREAGVAEIARVLRPGGRACVVEFAPGLPGSGLIVWLHRRGHLPRAGVESMLAAAGLEPREGGAVGIGGTYFVLAAKPG